MAGRRFRLAYLALALVLVGVYASTVAFRPAGDKPIEQQPGIKRAEWGSVTTNGAEPCVRSSQCSLRIVLGPLTNRTHVFLLETAWKGTAIGLQDNPPPVDVAEQLRYSPVLRCGLHIQGYGLDVQALSGMHCVPSAARRGTSFWLQITNLLAQPRAVVVSYYHDAPR